MPWTKPIFKRCVISMNTWCVTATITTTTLLTKHFPVHATRTLHKPKWTRCKHITPSYPPAASAFGPSTKYPPSQDSYQSIISSTTPTLDGGIRGAPCCIPVRSSRRISSCRRIPRSVPTPIGWNGCRGVTGYPTCNWIPVYHALGTYWISRCVRRPHGDSRRATPASPIEIQIVTERQTPKTTNVGLHNKKNSNRNSHSSRRSRKNERRNLQWSHHRTYRKKNTKISHFSVTANLGFIRWSERRDWISRGERFTLPWRLPVNCHPILLSNNPNPIN